MSPLSKDETGHGSLSHPHPQIVTILFIWLFVLAEDKWRISTKSYKKKKINFQKRIYLWNSHQNGKRWCTMLLKSVDYILFNVQVLSRNTS